MEEVPKKRWMGCSGAFFGVLIGAVLLMAMMAGASFVIEVPLYLAFGWVFFLKDNITRMSFGWEMIASSLIGLIFCVWLTHAFCSWVAQQKNLAPWRFAQTLRLNALVFLFFAASCALVGTVHQSIWLLGNPVVVDRSRNSDRLNSRSKMAHIYHLLLAYEEDHGKFPDSLQVLQDQGYIKDQEIFYDTKGQMREPFLYLGKGLSSSENSARVILVSPFLFNNQVVFLRVDGSRRVETLPPEAVGEEKFQEMIQEGIWPKNQQAGREH